LLRKTPPKAWKQRHPCRLKQSASLRFLSYGVFSAKKLQPKALVTAASVPPKAIGIPAVFKLRGFFCEKTPAKALELKIIIHDDFKLREFFCEKLHLKHGNSRIHAAIHLSLVNIYL